MWGCHLIGDSPNGSDNLSTMLIVFGLFAWFISALSEDKKTEDFFGLLGVVLFVAA